MRVMVRKCRFTGKIFEEKDRKKYIAHLKKLRAELAEKRKDERIRKTFSTWLAKEKKKILRPEDIPAWFLKNQRTLMDAANAGLGDRTFGGDKFFATDEFTKVEFVFTRYNPHASNSHVQPDKGVSNWCAKDKTKPTGYKGWTGQVSGTLKRSNAHMSSYPYGAALRAAGIKTGSGGGGNKSWSYEFTVFLDDWPGLKHTMDEIEQDQIVKKLKGV